MNLNPYDIQKLKAAVPNRETRQNYLRMAIVGPSDTGKSHLFKEMSRKVFIAHYDLVVVFCGSDDTRREYGQLFGTPLVYSEFDPRIIETLKQKQTQPDKTKPPVNTPPLSILVVYDDFANRSTRYNKEIFDLAISGRHQCISFVMMLHDLTCLDRVVRDNLTHMIITRQTASIVYETVAEQYLMMAFIGKYPEMNRSKLMNVIMNILHTHTGNYRMIMIDVISMKKNADPKLEDYLCTIRAPFVVHNAQSVSK
jgi:hypothetical protein